MSRVREIFLTIHDLQSLYSTSSSYLIVVFSSHRKYVIFHAHMTTLISTWHQTAKQSWKADSPLVSHVSGAISNKFLSLSNDSTQIGWGWRGFYATWSSRRCPRPWQEGWNYVIFKVPSIPNHSVILWDDNKHLFNIEFKGNPEESPCCEQQQENR